MVYSGFFKRWLALVLDLVFLFIPLCLVSMIHPALNGIVYFFYVTFFVSSAQQSTPGMAVLGLKITTLEGGRVSYQASVVRFLMSWVSGLCFFLGYLLYFVTSRKQTLHDIVAATVVINAPSVPSDAWMRNWNEEFKKITKWGEQNISQPKSQGSTSAEDLEKLEKLHALYQKGILSEMEYLEQKNKILHKS